MAHLNEQSKAVGSLTAIDGRHSAPLHAPAFTIWVYRTTPPSATPTHMQRTRMVGGARTCGGWSLWGLLTVGLINI